jgi:hypothetical protein
MRIRVLALSVVIALFGGAAEAQAGTKVINFDDQADGTTISNQYEASDNVTFTQSGSYLPVVRAVGSQAHSGANVADFSTCQGPGCGEGFPPLAARGDLSTHATSVSMYVGEITNGDPRAMPIQLTGYDGSGNVLAQSPVVMVNSGAGINTPLSISSATPMSYFVVEDSNGGDFDVAMDDISIATPDAPQPPDFSLTQGNSVLDAIQGASVQDPLTIHRANGSNGDIAMSVSGLPAGMTGSFSPNPVSGTSSTTTLTVTAAPTAGASTAYSPVTITGTPSASAGPSPRSVAAEARISENCSKTVTFTYVDLRDDGCLMKQANNTYQALNTTVRINGLVLTPRDGDHVLTVDPTGLTIKSDLGATYSVAVQGSPDTPFYYGPINWSFKNDYTGPVPLAQNTLGKPKSVEGIDISGVPFFQGIPLTGISVLFTSSAKAIVTPTLTLGFFPFNYINKDGITVNTSFITDNDNGASFNSLEIKVPDVNALALELKNVDLKYSNTNTWSGSADVVLDFADKLQVGGGFGIKNGSLDFLKADVGNINTPIGEGVYLQGLSFEVDLNPTTLKGGITLSAGPAVAGKTALSFTGGVTAVFADPWVIEVDGSAKVADKYDLASAFLRYTSTGLFEFGGNVGWNFDVLSLKGNVNGWVAGIHNFDVEGGVSGCVSFFIGSACADAKVLVSNLGLAGCVEIFGEGVGVGSHWGDDFDAFTGCDLSPWRPTKPTTRAVVATGAQQLTVAPGQSSVAWSIDGSGGRAPAITVVGPGHAAVSVSDVMPFVHNSRFWAAETSNGRTYVIVNHPQAGTWTIVADGSVAITRIREAVGLPKPKVTAKVGGKARSRVLSWKLKKIPGQVITFAEIGTGVRSVISSTSKASGSVHFTPADGPAGVRTIEAIVQQDNRPRATLTVASYRAPAAPRPGKPRAVKLTRKGTTLTVHWTPHPAGFRTAVSAEFSDGRKLVTVVSAKARSVSFANVASTTTGKITIMGLTAGNSKGPADNATLKPAHKPKPKKKHKKK